MHFTVQIIKTKHDQSCDNRNLDKSGDLYQINYVSYLHSYCSFQFLITLFFLFISFFLTQNCCCIFYMFYQQVARTAVQWPLIRSCVHLGMVCRHSNIWLVTTMFINDHKSTFCWTMKGYMYMIPLHGWQHMATVWGVREVQEMGDVNP